MAVIDATEAAIQGAEPSRHGRVLLAQLATLRSTKEFRQGEYQQALQWAEHGLHQIEAMRNEDPHVASTRIRLYQAVVTAAAMLGDHQRAQKVLNAALRLIQRYPNPVIEGELKLRRALLAMSAGKLAQAVRLFRQALPLIEATGTRDRVAYLLIPGGQTLTLRGQLEEAQQWLERGTRLGEEIDSTFLISSGLHLLGWLRLGTGEWDTAIACLQRGGQLAAQHELRDRLAMFMTFEGEICMYRGEYQRSEALFGQVMDLAQRYELTTSIITLQHNLAYSALMQGQLDIARTYRHDRTFTLETVQSYGQSLDLLSSAEWWAMLTDASGGQALSAEIGPIATAAKNSLHFLQQHGYRFSLVFAYRINAMLAYQAGQYEDAYRLVNQGIRLAHQIGLEPEAARCAYWRARIIHQQNPGARLILHDLHMAAEIFGRLGAQPELDQVVALHESIIAQSAAQ
jgi:tetratricopeptide (TPR) repeat protein